MKTSFLIAVAFLGITSVASAQTSTPTIYIPQNDLEKAAASVLDKNCARCHQDGKLVNRQKPAKAFGNILQLDQIAANPSLIQPGNPEGSKLVQQIANKDMPYDVFQEGDVTNSAPSEDDLNALRAWISGLKVRCEAKTVSINGMIEKMSEDIGKLPEYRRGGTRYLTLTNIAASCTPDKDMEVYRQATVKLLNSLSKYSDVLRLETIDSDKTVLRINLADLGWSSETWDRLVSYYPYAVRPANGQYDALSNATKTAVPFIRGDWFAFSASRDPIYSDILGLPDTFQSLESLLGVDTTANIVNHKVKRSGVQRSGVSKNNRLVERHQIATGAFWTSYDFASNSGKSNLFENPLGPGGEYGFVPDGGETIFNLPNGFQGYYLSTGVGKRLSKGPTSIVQDLSRRDLAVTNAISCMGCHNQGIRNVTDEVGPNAAANKSFPLEVREKVKALYPSASDMDNIISSDRKRFTDAMVKAGLDPDLSLNGVEMINALSARYEWDVNLQEAAAEFGVPPEEMKDGMIASGGMGKSIALRLDQGMIPRDQFETIYSEVVDRIIDAEHIRVQQATGVAELQTYVAPVEANGEVSRKNASEAIATLRVILYADRSAYMVNDKPVFTVRSDRECYLNIINIDGKGDATVIFPNRFQQDNKIAANQDFVFPSADANFDFKFTEAGKETVIAVCDTTGNAIDIAHSYDENAFTPLGETKAALRKIEVQEREKPKANAEFGIPPASSGVGRTAIVLAVQ